MPLEFADFAHHYEGLGLGEGPQRDHFEVFADIMECLVRTLWRDTPLGNRLGIRFEDDTLACLDAVESDHAIRKAFNRASSGDAGRRIDP